MGKEGERVAILMNDLTMVKLILFAIYWLLKAFHSRQQQHNRLGMALKASKVVGNPVTLHWIW
jgi:hypothetical protein